MKEDTKKQKWIEQQQDKAVKVHHKNLDRIKKIEDKITTNLYRIYSLQVSMNLLEEQEDEQFEYGLDFLRQQAKKFDTHSKTYILREILIKKHKLKAVEAYVYFSKFEVKYGKRKS